MKYSDIIKHLEKRMAEIIQGLFTLPELPVVSVNVPTDRSKADLVSNASFVVAKVAHVSPVDAATKTAEALNADTEVAEYFKVSAMAPGFINFHVTNKFLLTVLEDVISAGADYGKNEMYAGQTWVVEHTSPNPNKAMHIGHLRNNAVGMAIARSIEASGAKNVIYDMIDNNRGIAIAKAMWGYLASKNKQGISDKDVHYWVGHTEEWFTPADANIKSDHYIGECYQFGADAYKANEETAKAINQMVVDWESDEPDTWALWKQITDWSHQGINETLTILKNRFDNQWHEHEHYKMGKDFVEKGLSTGIFKKLPDGAVLSNLESFKLPDTILLKSTGTALYITQDIALTNLKRDKFKADKMIWVIGPEQGMAMKQVFAICEQLGIGKKEDYIHIPYGLVKVRDESGVAKKMSSRGGSTLYIDDLIDTVTEQLTATDRGYSKELAQDIAVSAIKYAILKIGRNSDVTIDLDNVISLEGDSGVYILYTYGRMNSLLGKADQSTVTEAVFADAERDLIMQLLYYPQWVQSAAKDFAPNLIAESLLKLAQTFNTFYGQERIISEDANATAKKLMLTKAITVAYKNGLELLGMSPLTKI